MASCELCGKNATTKARIEGVILGVCDKCATLGTPVVAPKAPLQKMKPQGLAASLGEQSLVADFHTRLRAARVRRGLNEEDAAKLLNLHKSTLLHFESGKMHPDDVTAKKLEKFYGISLFELV